MMPSTTAEADAGGLRPPHLSHTRIGGEYNATRKPLDTYANALIYGKETAKR